ncbi:hypothetical protein DITRI_Ditri12bG0109600 [Diplodiscus trichospermus]
MVALRCLEELFGPKSGLENVAPPVSRVAFDLASSCEDVLKCILQEASLSDLKKAGPELLRWDVQPFIKHKRASLPKCALEQLKASILKEIPVLDGHENVPTPRFDDSDSENGNQDGNLIPQISENDDEVLQDELLERNVLPSKRCRNDMVTENVVGLVSVNQDSMDNDLHLNVKKFKQDATIQSFQPNSIRLHGEGLLKNESGMITKATEIENNNLGKDSQADEDDQDMHVASRTLEQSNAVNHVELQNNQKENVQNADADVMVEQKYGDRPWETVVMDESDYVENDALQKGSSADAGENIDRGFPLSSPNSASADVLQQNIHPDEAKADMEHPCVEQIRENEDERFNIALNKSLFLSSHCRPSQDPVGKVGWTEQNFCVKCNQNGQVLVCSSSGCPLVVHESCLDSAARFDDKGNFYCPFCAYSLSISEYLEAKDKTSLARKELGAFMELCSKILTEEQWKLQSHSRLNGGEEVVGIQEGGLLGEREHDFVSHNREVNHGPSASCLNGNQLCVEEETSMCATVDIQVENNEEEEKVYLRDRSMREHEQGELPAKLKSNDDNPTNENIETAPTNQVEVEVDMVKEAVEPQITEPASNDDNPTSENIETAPTNQVEVEGDMVKEAVEPQITEPAQKPACAINSDGEESSTHASDKFIISSYSTRKRETKFSFPPAPQLRRKKVPWTNDEEEMLRKGVEKFGNDGGPVPWKRILDFGAKVFLRGRTTVDLKDKWRNMCKGSPRCK